MGRRPRVTSLLLDGAHRFTIVAMLAAAAAVACLLAGRQTPIPLAIAFAASVGGLCLTLLVLSASPKLAALSVLACLGLVTIAYAAAGGGSAWVACWADVLACVTVAACTANRLTRTVRRDAWTACLVQSFLVVATSTAMIQSRGEQVAAAIEAFFTPPPALSVR